MRRILLSAIRLYQRIFSADTGVLKTLYLTDGACRFQPRCSEYTYQAIAAYGIIDGLVLGFKRILRCHPWNQGGYDPLLQNKQINKSDQ